MCFRASVKLVCGLLCVMVASFHEAVADEARQLRPSHERPYFMPVAERDRIRNTIRTQPWAKSEYERIRTEAEKGNGFWAGFLYALDGDAKHLDAARKFLMGSLGPDAWNVRHYAERLTAYVFLANDADRVRLDGDPLFLLSEGEGDQRAEMLGREPAKLGVWPGHQPANLVAEAYGRTSDDVMVKAALLDFPDGELDLAFQFNPQQVTFRDMGMEFSIRVVQRDNWHIGFCKPDEFDQWQGARSVESSAAGYRLGGPGFLGRVVRNDRLIHPFGSTSVRPHREVGGSRRRRHRRRVLGRHVADLRQGRQRPSPASTAPGRRRMAWHGEKLIVGLADGRLVALSIVGL